MILVVWHIMENDTLRRGKFASKNIQERLDCGSKHDVVVSVS